jgi:hypothetical protein
VALITTKHKINYQYQYTRRRQLKTMVYPDDASEEEKEEIDIVDGECKTTENTIISNGPQKYLESENTNTITTK